MKEAIEELKEAVNEALRVSGHNFVMAQLEVSRKVGNDFRVMVNIGSAHLAVNQPTLPEALKVWTERIEPTETAEDLRDKAAILIRQAERLEAGK